MSTEPWGVGMRVCMFSPVSEYDNARQLLRGGSVSIIVCTYAYHAATLIQVYKD